MLILTLLILKVIQYLLIDIGIIISNKFNVIMYTERI